MTGPAVTRAQGRGGGWRRAFLVAGAAVGIVAVLAAGIALGMALHDNPKPTGPLTVEHTVELAPATGPAAATATASR